jgi:hypothetical protein
MALSPKSISNVRDKWTDATILPQYNTLNIMYRLYVEIFDRIRERRMPPYLVTYMDENNITNEQITEQQQLISDLLDGLLEYRYPRDPDMDYVHAAMRDCRWQERFDWRVMMIFDTLASQSMLATWFNTIADLYRDTDVKAQSPGDLRKLIDRNCKEAYDIVLQLHGETEKEEESNT